MIASEIRARFLEQFAQPGHATRLSSPLLPGADPTPLFTDSGTIHLERVFPGREAPSFGGQGVTPSRTCVRAGGEHGMLRLVTDDRRERDVGAEVIMRDVAVLAGRRRGGKSHMTHADPADAARVPTRSPGWRA